MAANHAGKGMRVPTSTAIIFMIQRSVQKNHRIMVMKWRCEGKQLGFLGLAQGVFSERGPVPNAMSENLLQLYPRIERNH